MNERPEIPSAALLKQAEQVAAGSAKLLLEQHVAALAAHERRLDEQLSANLAYFRHVATYRYVSVLSGLLLAVVSLGVITFAIDRGAALTQLAAVLTPIAGLAGVFLWGYRPSGSRAGSGERTSAKRVGDLGGRPPELP